MLDLLSPRGMPAHSPWGLWQWPRRTKTGYHWCRPSRRRTQLETLSDRSFQRGAKWFSDNKSSVGKYFEFFQDWDSEILMEIGFFVWKGHNNLSSSRVHFLMHLVTLKSSKKCFDNDMWHIRVSNEGVEIEKYQQLSQSVTLQHLNKQRERGKC